MLQEHPLQFLIAKTPGSRQCLVIASIGLLVTALLHEDLGCSPKVGNSVAVAS